MYGIGIFLALHYLYRDYKIVIHTYWNGGFVFLADGRARVYDALLYFACV